MQVVIEDALFFTQPLDCFAPLAPPCRNTHHGRDDVLPACQETLKNLQLDYLDLYLIHWPIEFKKDSELWKLSDDDKLGYDAERLAQCWEVGCRTG